MSNTNQFDARFKEKIGEISTNPLYGSWDTFQKKWKDADSLAPVLPDSVFDEGIKSKLTRVKPGLPSGHWQRLKYRLETIEIFRDKIIIHKIKEVVAVGLFIFTFFNVTRFPETEIQQTEKRVYATRHDKVTLRTIAEPFSLVKNEVKREGLRGLKRKVADFSKIISAGVSETADAEVRHIDGINSLIKTTGQSIVTPDSKPGYMALPAGKQVLQETRVLPVKKRGTYSEMAVILPMQFIQDKKNTIETRIGLIASKMHNFILTPFDKVYSVPEFSKSTNNFGYGVSLGKKRGHGEIETGVMYSRLNYRPVEIRETFASAADVYFETSLKKIQFDLVKIPLNLKYYAVDTRSWKFYLVGGASLNLLANAQYVIEENIIKGRPVSSFRFSNEGPRLDNKPFTYGFFNKGNFRENYYVDIVLGMGLELRIGRNLHFYCQPAYHAFVFSDDIGIGPNQDKLNAFVAQTGFKWTLPR